MKLFRQILNQLSPYLIFVIFLQGCSEIRLIGAYNENVDKDLQEISKDISALYAQIEANIDDDKDYSYDHFRDNYIKIEGEIQNSITVANGLPKYRIISTQLQTLASAVGKMKAIHKKGFVASTVTDKTKIKQSVDEDKSAMATAMGSILALQEGLKREKADKTNKP